MKKLLFAIACLLGVSSSLQARDEIIRDISLLPQLAQTTISKNFKADVSFIKIERNHFNDIEDYEVILTDGTEVKFEPNGRWDSVETPRSKKVPAAFVPSEISDYVSKNYKRVRIVSIDKERYGYDVELSNGLDLVFDRNGRFVGFDD